jgi:hypothetical protein
MTAKSRNNFYVVDTTNYTLPYTPLAYWQLADVEYVLQPDLRLIGDETDSVITISGNTTLCYTPGEYNNNTYTAKTLQYNAPSEYDENGNVISRTWMTYNTYTASEWANGYHFKGEG